MNHRLRYILVVAALCPTSLGIAQSAGGYLATDVGTDEVFPMDLEEAAASGRGLRIGQNGPVPDFHVVRQGDTLWMISERYYENPWQWPRLWSYNPEITNPHWIYPDHRIRLRASVGPEQATLTAGPGQRRTLTRRGQGSVLQLVEQGYLDNEALRTSGVIVGSPEEYMLLSPHSRAYVRFRDSAHAVPGQEYTVYREMQNDEREEGEEGKLVRIFGTLRITSVDRNGLARGVVVNANDAIERGCRVSPMVRHFVIPATRRNERTVKAKVIAMVQPRKLIGDYQVVFVNKGSNDGIALGNRFLAIRRNDEWVDSIQSDERDLGASVDLPEAPPTFPETTAAELIVVDVRPKSAAAVVLRSRREISVGDPVEMRAGY